MQQYKDQHLFDDRLKLSANIMERFPDRIPVICEPRDEEKISLDKKKFLCPRDFKMGHFVITLRKRLKGKLRASEALYIFSNNVALPNNLSMEEIYESHKDPDGLLYFTFDKENTFGSLLEKAIAYGDEREEETGEAEYEKVQRVEERFEGLHDLRHV